MFEVTVGLKIRELDLLCPLTLLNLDRKTVKHLCGLSHMPYIYILVFRNRNAEFRNYLLWLHWSWNFSGSSVFKVFFLFSFCVILFSSLRLFHTAQVWLCLCKRNVFSLSLVGPQKGV